MLIGLKKFIKNYIDYRKYKLPKPDKMLNIKHLEAHLSKIKCVDILDKKSVKTVFIDDEGYNIEEILKLGYVDTHVIKDYDKISDFEQYDVIFCDINGVARKLDPINQGAELAYQIKKTYPDKTVIIFTSRKQNVKNITYYQDKVDYLIPKSTRITDMCDIIDNHIKKKYNPVLYWKSKEKAMRKNKVPNNVISIIEHYYVLSMMNNKDLIDNVLLKYQKKFPIDDFIEMIEDVGTDIVAFLPR